MILANNLSKSYGSIKALDDVSISVSAGEICGILGPNGAGKSTLFKILCNLVTQDSGTFEVNSNKVKPIGAIIEKPGFYDYLSAYDNLSILLKIQRASRDKKKIKTLLDLVGLSDKRKDSVKQYSLGMKQRLGIAIALIGDPDCLIFDEPFLGLDPLGMRSLRELIKTLAYQNDKAILISSHLLEELSLTCDTLYVIQQGRVLKSGPTGEILNGTTDTFRVCGKHLVESKILQELQIEIDGECATFKLEVTKASQILQALIEEGNEINYFSPEKNLNALYNSK